MRPFFPFYGSKWNIARHYPLPEHDTVIEPFAGAAGYSTFHGVPRAVLIDRDPIIAGVWEYLLSVRPEEIMALPELPEVGDSVDDHRIPIEAKWLIGFWLNRGSAVPKRSRTAYSARTDRSQLNWGPKAKRRIASQLDGIAGWTVQHTDYSVAPDAIRPATWFIDPPYEIKGSYYRFRLADEDYDELGRWARQREGQVTVCEGERATWLPFEPLGSFKSSLGRSHEQVWVR